MISLDTARQLLNFSGTGARISPAQAEAQLEGAVAIHNILQKHGVAYLADEVGMGKTYVALGAFALFRHFQPDFRMLVIAPKGNIQQKWVKELHNFVRNNVGFADRRIKAIHLVPARPAVLCDNLIALVRETTLDPDRDFFARLSSFSLGLADDPQALRRKRDEILALLPWLDRDLFHLHSKDAFKENFARAVCCALPEFDLVIVDEAHNLKGGLGSTAWRNKLLALCMGREPGGVATPCEFRHFGPRAKRVLLLSATPLEDDYRHVWNQLSVFGLEAAAAGLNDAACAEEEKRKILSHLLIRRVNEVQRGEERLTKNQYRREWRNGGVAIHDEPLRTPDEKQQLVVALVQKKVCELLGSERFNNSFQIGMLASFESFLQTAKVREDAPANFDDSEQADRLDEREGIDVQAVNRMAQSYVRRFGEEMPHPKMDALVETLKSSFDTGDKALVFVRRIFSVKELQQKLETAYDGWLMNRLRRDVRSDLQGQLEGVFQSYTTERRTKRQQTVPRSLDTVPSSPELDDEFEPVHPEVEDRGGNETFFSWFFRGEGPARVFSGAELAYRCNIPGSALSSFFLDNWVAWLLEAEPGQVFRALKQRTNLPEESLRESLELIAGSVVPVRTRNRHREMFLAFQYAAITLLARESGELGRKAAIAQRQLFAFTPKEARSLPLGDWLEVETLFTALRRRAGLRAELWPDEPGAEFLHQFRRRELRRELIASMCRLGNPLIDLWTLYVNQTGRLDLNEERSDFDPEELRRGFLDLLERQRQENGFTTYRELREAAEHFDLILDTNAPSLWERPMEEVTTELGKLLREQQPVGGMWGEVNRTLVRQFRMPGYPLVLITTDLLQEGEDLHLFCSRVYHYGISWMPSSMEQRIGRIDRVRSQTERRLTELGGCSGSDLLQVFYPYLQETVEVFQVERVFERLNRFLRLVHEKFGAADEGQGRKIDILFEAQRGKRDTAPILEPLRSAFPIRREWLTGPRRPLAVDPGSEAQILRRFEGLREIEGTLPVEWLPGEHRNALIGTMVRQRRQPFTLLLHSVSGMLNVRCVSPVGRVDVHGDTDRIAREAAALRVRVGAVFDPRFEQYDLTAESDVLLGVPMHDLARVGWLLETVASAADRLEEILLAIDREPELFHDDLKREASFER